MGRQVQTLVDALGRMARRAAVGTLSVVVSASLVPVPSAAAAVGEGSAGEIRPGDGDAPDGDDGLSHEAGVPEGDPDCGTGEDAGPSGQGTGDDAPGEGDAGGETSAPVLVQVALDGTPILETLDDGTVDAHADVELVSARGLSVTVRDEDGDLELVDAEGGAASRVEVLGPAGEVACYGLRPEGDGGDYELDVEGGVVALQGSGAFTVRVCLRDGDPSHDVDLERTVTIDAEPPEIEVEPGEEGPGKEGGRVFAARTALVRVSDERCLIGDPQVMARGGDIDLSAWTWSEDRRSATATVTFREGSFSGLEVSASDGVNQRGVSALEGPFEVDSTAPSLAAVEVMARREGDAPDVGPRQVDARQARAESPVYLGSRTVTVRVDDAHPDALAARTAGGESYAVVDEGGGLYSFELGEGACPEITITARDEAGRSSEAQIGAGSLVVDTQSPVIEGVTAGPEGGAVASRGARLGIGCETLTVSVRDANLAEDGGPVRAEVASRDGTTETVALGRRSLADGQGAYELALDDGAYARIDIRATDKAGNASPALTLVDVLVDTQAPVFTILEEDLGEYVGPSLPALDGYAYLRHGRRVWLTVADANIDEESASSLVSVANEGRPVGVSWRREGDVLVGTPEVDGTADGRYRFSVSGRDPAGNAAVPSDGRSETEAFVVDQAPPSVSVTEATAGLHRGEAWTDADCDYLFRSQTGMLYFRHPVRSVITVDDANLQCLGSEVDVDGISVPFPDGAIVRWGDVCRVSDSLLVEWLRDGDHHTCIVTYEDQGAGSHLTPTVRAEDKAGNVTVAGEPQTPFVVDAAAPRIALAWGGADAADPCPANISGGRAYYDVPRRVTTTVEESHWDLSQSTGDVIHVEDLDRGQSPRSSFETTIVGGGGPASRAFETTFRDGDYRFWMEAHDLAGNVSEVRDTSDFVVDTVAPVIDVSFDGGRGPGGRCFAGARTMTVVVTERNFDPSLVHVVVRTSRSERAGSVDVNDPGRWTSVGDRHAFVYRFEEDGTYEVEVSASDLARNEGQARRVDAFVIDRTPPEVSVRPVRAADASLGGIDRYRRPIAWEVSIRDRNLDVTGAQASVARILGGNAHVPAVREWEHDGVEADGTVTWRTTVIYDEQPASRAGETSWSLEVHAVDMAGNASDVAALPFHVDRTAPSIVRAGVSREPSATDDGSDYQFFDQATSMTFSFHDPYGLASATLLDPDGEYVVRGDVTPGDTDGSITVDLVDGTRRAHDTEYERNVTLMVTDVAGNVRVWTIDRQGEVVDDVGSSADNVSLGGRGIHPSSLVEDVTAPRVALSGVSGGAYYASDQLVHVEVDEFNLSYLRRFDPDRSVVVVRRREGVAGGATSSFALPASGLVGSGSVWAADLALAGDGHYSLVGRFRDFAGNESNAVEIGEFTIDQTDPVASVSWDNTDVRNGRYYDAPRTATVSVLEHNFDPTLVTVSTTGAVSGWVDAGDVHTCTVSFGEGVHELRVTATDLAGNVAQEVAEPAFVVDTTPPTLVIGGLAQRLGQSGEGLSLDGTLEDHNAYNGIVRPEVTFADEANLDEGSIDYSLVGGKNGDVTQAFAHDSRSADGGMTVRYEDLGRLGQGAGYDVGADDVYTLRGSVSDLAGNTVQATVAFSVNRFGSNYLVTVDGEEASEGNALLTSAPTIRVREVNVSGAASEASHGVVKEYANVTSAIVRDDGEGARSGYRLEAPEGGVADDYGWAEYLYTVRSGNFGKGSDSDAGEGGQGTYRVNVFSDDAASNANGTASYWRSDERREAAEVAGATTQFTLDEVPPAIDEMDLPSSVGIGRAFEASLHVTDAITTGNLVEVTVDGEPVEVRGPKDGRGTFYFDIPSRAFVSRDVRVVVTDYAGRVVEASAEGIHVTDLVVEAGVAALTLSAAGAVLALWRRKARPAAVADAPRRA